MSIFEKKMETKRETSEEEEKDEDEFDQVLCHCVEHECINSKRWQSKVKTTNGIQLFLFIVCAGSVYRPRRRVTSDQPRRTATADR